MSGMTKAVIWLSVILVINAWTAILQLRLNPDIVIELGLSSDRDDLLIVAGLLLLTGVASFAYHLHRKIETEPIVAFWVLLVLLALINL